MKKSLWVFVCLAALAGFLLIRLFSPTSVRAIAGGSLAALWHFDEGVGTSAFDSSGNGNVGTLMATTTLPTWTSGKFESAIAFDGTDDFVQVADSPSLDIPGSLTVEAWIDGASFGAINTIVSKENASFPFNVNYNFHVLGGKLFFSVTFNGGATFASGSGGCDAGGCFVAGATTVSTGVFHHVAGVYDNVGKTLSVYLDGVLDGTATFTTTANPFTNADPVLIGTRNFSPTFFNGVMDEVRIWNRNLGANEVLASAQAGLHALWHFNESAGPIADSSGYGNTGAVTGATFAAGQTNFGNAASFDGTDDYISVPNSSQLSVFTNISVEAWIKTIANEFYPSIVSKGNVGTFVESYALFLDPTGHPSFLVNLDGTSGGRRIVISSSKTVTLGAWEHIAGTYDGTNVCVYLDGAPAGCSSYAPSASQLNITPDALLIGKSLRTGSAFPDSFFDGLIDETHIWARVLSVSEIEFLAGVDAFPACSDGGSACKGELVVPDEIDQELDGGSGGVVTSEWEYGGPATPRHAMGLAFMVANDPTGSVTIRPPSNGLIVPSCATDKGSTPGTPVLGGLDGCEISADGKSALITGHQVPVTVGKSTITASKTLHLFINLSDSNKVGAAFQWQ